MYTSATEAIKMSSIQLFPVLFLFNDSRKVAQWHHRQKLRILASSVNLGNSENVNYCTEETFNRYQH